MLDITASDDGRLPDFPPVSKPMVPGNRRPRSQVLRDIADIHDRVPDANMIDVNEVRKALAMELPNSIQTVFDFARTALPLWEAVLTPPPEVAEAMERWKANKAKPLYYDGVRARDNDVFIIAEYFLSLAAHAAPENP